ncbi:hypothetical protein LTR37_010219 [Vermiconidia calcicola]|uniref:Uncharacterized protein n=1 Tax=Vermiconidia calcicola TaxID=1690605 RepID=A0ACC3N8E1_9PEZI|nr:hypothetical protein LTR37_010219 [Vermiconidia calcicola]
MYSIFVTSALLTQAVAAPSLKLRKYVDALDLEFSFNPVIPAYWTSLPHHRRTPFSVSPDGKTGYLAYLDASGSDVHVQHVDVSTMKSKDYNAITIPNLKEAGGIVGHGSGNTPVPAIYRYQKGKQLWKTFVAGPGVHPDDGLMMSPDMNGDLAYSPESGMYGAYIVVTAYTGFAEGHFGDSIQYVNEKGALQTIDASSAWGCSHHTGIAFEAAAEPPFASICAEDQGAIWLNTDTQGMSNDGVKISNEQVTNGASGEPVGGMSGSYSSLAKFQNSTEYIFAWVSRGAVDLTTNDWMGAGYTHAENRTNGRQTAMAILSDKNTLVGPEATSEVGAANGDSQVNWVTESEGPDRSNAHVATFDDTYALITWEEIATNLWGSTPS